MLKKRKSGKPCRNKIEWKKIIIKAKAIKDKIELKEKIRKMRIQKKLGERILSFVKGCSRLKESKIIKVVHLIFNVITVFTTFIAFIGVPIYIYGLVTKRNISNNNLIMEQILEETEGGEITSIDTSDIHGFGYNSIIVSIANEDYMSKNVKNKLIIMDFIDGSILRKMNDLFEFKSAYRTTFSFTLHDNISTEFYPKINYVMDIIGGTSKEIIVRYGVHKQNSPASNIYLYAIFQYSYDREKFELMGTYPQVEKYDLVTEYVEGNKYYISRKAKRIITNFHSMYNNPKGVVPCYDDDNNHFNITPFINQGDMQFWVYNKNYGNMLVLASVDMEEKKVLINCYEPTLSDNENEIEWLVEYSEYMDIEKSECKNEVIEKLETDLNVSFEILQEVGK